MTNNFPRWRLWVANDLAEREDVAAMLEVIGRERQTIEERGPAPEVETEAAPDGVVFIFSRRENRNAARYFIAKFCFQHGIDLTKCK